MNTRSQRSRTTWTPTPTTFTLFFLLVLLLSTAPALAQQIIHVDADATGADNGTSWANAYTSLQVALFFATGNDQIWIAEGTYQPDQGPGLTPGDRSLSFTVTGNQDGLQIYGGFAGTETMLSQRDVSANPVILSGDLGEPGDNADNSYHVLFFDGGDGTGTDIAANVTTATLLDGVIITGGNANGTLPDNSGGGILCDGVDDNADSNECSPTLNGVTFHTNEASFGGGAFYSYGLSSPVITNSVFYDNQAQFGGALFNDGFHGETTMRIVNSTFYGNRATADESGGALWINGTIMETGPTLINSIFYGNTSPGTGLDEIGLTFATVTFSNTLVEGGINGSGVGGFQGTVSDGGGNLDADPLFLDANDPDGADDTFATSDDGLRLATSSPAINAGSNDAVPAGVTTDITGADRIQNDTVDMGAYEVFVDPALTIYVDTEATGTGDGTSWANAYTSLQVALFFATGNDQIWIAEGTYQPDQGPGLTPGDRSLSFTVTGNQDGLEIYGGFAGTETERSQRDVSANPVILSGDIGTLADNADNSFHVFLFDGGSAIGTNVEADITSATVLDGVIITGGNANGTSPDNVGGGIYCDGAESGNTCSPTLRGVVFADNRAEVLGGAIFNNGTNGESSPAIINSLFTGNTSFFGGAIFNAGEGGFASPVITNSTFQGNIAEQGASLFNTGANAGNSNPVVVNSILFGNTSVATGREIENAGGATPQISSSLIGGSGGSGASWDANLGIDGGSNLGTDPLFVDANDPDGADDTFATSDDGLRLATGSPARDAGSNTAISGTTTDLTGADRIAFGTVDMGAYEAPDEALTLYVDADAAGANNGTSWADAFTDLQSALATATGNDQIWIAAGTYKPTSGTDRAVSFTVTEFQDGLKFYGGFAGTETLLSERDWRANPVILSGDIGTLADSTDNSFHVLLFDGTLTSSPGTNVTEATVLDGVTVTAGNADGFTNSSGGGLRCKGNGSGNACSPVITNTVFTGNTASSLGGAIFNNGSAGGTSSPTITNTVFTGNTASSRGGAIFNGGSNGASSPVITNSVFSGNTASSGGGIYSDAKNGGTSSPVITNSTFFGNVSQEGPSLYSIVADGGTSRPALTNSILYGNISATTGREIENDGALPQISFSLIGGSGGSGGGWDINLGTDGGNNLDADPLFLDPTDPDGADDVWATSDDGLRLATGSPAANAGSNDAINALLPAQQPLVPLAVTVDLAGADRIQDGTVDMGAYEGEATPLPIELASFQARQTNRDALLQWSTQSETHNAGFEVQWQSETDWETVGYVPGAGTTTEAQSYHLTHSFPPSVAVIGTHRFRLKQLDLDGRFAYSAEVELTIGVEGTHEVEQIFPNPLRGQGRLRFAVAEPQQVRVEVYDVVGRCVGVLYDGEVAANRTEEVLWHGDRLASGVYFVRVVGERFSDTQQVVLVK